MYADCKEALESGHTSSGIYTVNPDDQLPFKVSARAKCKTTNGCLVHDTITIKVYCDMKTDGGGWTVFQRRQDGSVDFFLGWEDYKNEFRDLDGEFWLGLDKIHRLTTSNNGQQSTLRFDLGDHEGNKRYAKYSTFQMANSSTNYRLTVAGYSGDDGDSFSSHSGRMFTTRDCEHDIYGTNCASDYKGAW